MQKIIKFYKKKNNKIIQKIKIYTKNNKIVQNVLHFYK